MHFSPPTASPQTVVIRLGELGTLNGSLSLQICFAVHFDLRYYAYATLPSRVNRQEIYEKSTFFSVQLFLLMRAVNIGHGQKCFHFLHLMRLATI